MRTNMPLSVTGRWNVSSLGVVGQQAVSPLWLLLTPGFWWLGGRDLASDLKPHAGACTSCCCTHKHCHPGSTPTDTLAILHFQKGPEVLLG